MIKIRELRTIYYDDDKNHDGGTPDIMGVNDDDYDDVDYNYDDK